MKLPGLKRKTFKCSRNPGRRRSFGPAGFLLLVLSLAMPISQASGAGTLEPLTNRLRQRVLLAAEPQGIFCRSEVLCGSALLPQLYVGRAFHPAWIDESGPNTLAFELLEEIRWCDREGLDPADYHLNAVESLIREIRRALSAGKPAGPDLLADLELLLSDAFLLFGSHLSAGRVNPETVHAEWHIKTRKVDLVESFQEALEQAAVRPVLERMRPRNPGYSRLRRALRAYEDIQQQGGWPTTPAGPLMKKGERSERVAALRKRLSVTDELENPGQADPRLFDASLEEALRRFQLRHGLEADGIVGPATLAALNIGVAERLATIRINLERWRWLPLDFGSRYILVNIADYAMDVVEENGVVMSMRVIVGRDYRKTPVFSGSLTYMEVNPLWHIPPKIAREDILPKVRRNPNYLGEQKIRVFRGWSKDAPEIPPQEINWSRMRPSQFSFKLRQDPGPLNALGRIKFMLPNKFDVYLHDTPSRELFGKNRRDFSSGCIRIEKPVELADFLMLPSPGWQHERLLRLLETGQTTVLSLPRPIPVHLLYWTAWVTEDGVIHFREDLYGRDGPVGRALLEPPPVQPQNQRAGSPGS